MKQRIREKIEEAKNRRKHVFPQLRTRQPYTARKTKESLVEPFFAENVSYGVSNIYNMGISESQLMFGGTEPDDY